MLAVSSEEIVSLDLRFSVSKLNHSTVALDHSYCLISTVVSRLSSGINNGSLTPRVH